VRGDAMQLRMEGVPGEAATRHLRLYSTPSMPSGTPTRMSIQAVPAMPAMPINPQPPHKVTRPHMGGLITGPAVPSMPGGHVERQLAEVSAKLDQLIKHAQNDNALEKLHAEVERLRREVEELKKQ
ncbi:MAG TPA: hypothetical protein VL096_00735, partial [Pirellulaceae bacterium]|nr:hypothetical protein [Pirellulaceae bacterium]